MACPRASPTSDNHRARAIPTVQALTIFMPPVARASSPVLAFLDGAPGFLAGVYVDYNCPVYAFRRISAPLDHAIVRPSMKNFCSVCSEVRNRSCEPRLESIVFLVLSIHGPKNLLLHIPHRYSTPSARLGTLYRPD